MQPTILRDTREKTNRGWWFRPWEGVAGTQRIRLETGDYSIRGLESVVTIERKGSVLELASNLWDRGGRFRREMERLATFELAVVCCTFPFERLEQFPQGLTGRSATIAEALRFKGPFLLKRLERLQNDFPSVQWVFTSCDDEARQRTLRFLLAAWRKYGDAALSPPAPTEVLTPQEIGG